LVAWVRERFGRICCRETIRAALHRLDLSWKKAKKLLGRANPVRRQVFVEQLQSVLAAAQRDQHLLVYLDEAHIHQDADLGYGWATRGQRLWVASSSPGLSAKVSFYGLYLYNEAQVRLWPYPRANGAHTIDVLRRGRLGRRIIPPGRCRTRRGGDAEHRADAAAGLQPRPDAGRGAVALAARGRDLPSLPSQPGRPHPSHRRLPGPRQSTALRPRRPPLGQRPARSRGGKTQVLKLDAV